LRLSPDHALAIVGAIVLQRGPTTLTQEELDEGLAAVLNGYLLMSVTADSSSVTFSVRRPGDGKNKQAAELFDPPGL
jgi:hypothetical protein